MSLVTKMSEPSPQSDLLPMELPLMSLPAASRAKTLAMPARKLECLTAQDPGFGLRSSDWLAKWDRDSSSWRTSQVCLVAQASSQADGLAEFSETWPSAGMMRNGIAYPLRELAPHTDETGSGLLPTPLRAKVGTHPLDGGGRFTRAITQTLADYDRERQLQSRGSLSDKRQRALHGVAGNWDRHWHEVLNEFRSLDDGVSGRLDDSFAGVFGNAVVPQIPELIGRAILDANAVLREVS